MPDTQDSGQQATTNQTEVEPDASPEYPRDEFDVDVVPGQRRGAHRTAPPPLLAAMPWVLVGLFALACIVALFTVINPSDNVAAKPTPRPTTTASATPTPTETVPEVDKGVRLLLLNGTRRSSNLTSARTKLVDDGWIVADTGRNEDRDVETTLVVYRTESLRPTADALAAFLGSGTVSFDPNLPEEMRVVIGENYKR